MINLAMRQIKGQYKRTIFGQLWSLANPMALMVVYTFVFSFVFRVQPEPGNPSGINVFSVWLLCGLLPWIFFNRALTAGVKSIVSNEGLVQKVYFARVVLPFSEVVANAYNWLFEMGVLLVVILILGGNVITTLPFLVLSMLLLIIFATGCALLLSVCNVYFRDTEHIVSLVLQLWIYLTPVVYPTTLVMSQSEKLGPLFWNVTLMDIYQLNPMEQFMVLFRSVLYDITVPSLPNLIACLLWSLIVFTFGILLFAKVDKKLAEAL